MPAETDTGIRQGCPLSSILFNIYRLLLIELKNGKQTLTQDFIINKVEPPIVCR
jgi:hypothetical protein